jgi:hypothetical protein
MLFCCVAVNTVVEEGALARSHVVVTEGEGETYRIISRDLFSFYSLICFWLPSWDLL